MVSCAGEALLSSASRPKQDWHSLTAQHDKSRLCLRRPADMPAPPRPALLLVLLVLLLHVPRGVRAQVNPGK